MKKFIIFLLVFILVFSSISSFAVEEYYIHTGLKKIYRVDRISDLIDDIISGHDINKFYRVLEDGSYVNVKAEENAHLEYIKRLVENPSSNIKSQEDLERHIAQNETTIRAELNRITSDLKTSFDKISDVALKDYINYDGESGTHLLKTPDNYSIPISGSKEGTTMIKSLTFPTGSSQWLYKILDKPENDLEFNQEVDGMSYKAEEDIEIQAGKHLSLYATDRSNRLKAYTSIKIEDNMIKKAAELIKGGTISKGKSLAFSISIDGIEGNWKYLVRSQKLNNIFVDNRFSDATEFIKNKDILVSDENTVLDENFKKFVYLISEDEIGNIDKYYLFEVNKDLVSQPPIKLIADTNYIGPIKGSTDETTRFDKLEFGENSFKYIKESSIISIPALNSDFVGTIIAQGSEIKAKAGEHLLLVTVDGNSKVKAYEKFVITENQIKGITPEAIDFIAVKGNKPSTTMVKGLTLSNDLNKWMYIVGKDLADPVLDKIYTGSMDYILGTDIEGKGGETLMLFETDSAGRVKKSGKVTLDENMLKASLAYNLANDKGAYLKDPVKGNVVGSIKFDFLRYEGLNFMLIHSDDKIAVPEKDETVKNGIDIELEGFSTKDIKIFEEDAPILKSDEGPKEHAMIVAVNDKNEIQAYYSFELNRNNVKLPKAGELNKTMKNYSAPIPGDTPSSTKIEKLDSTGLAKFSSFRYKVIDEEIEIEYNTIIPGTTLLKENQNITASLGKYLLILGVDSNGRAKYYDIVPLTSNNLRYPDAKFLEKGINFSEPVPGVEYHSTRIKPIKLPDGATKWMYKVLDNSYGAAQANVKVAESKDLVEGEDITPVKVNQWLLILATDDAGLVKGYYNQRLSDINIKGGPAEKLEENLNYIIAKGSKAGTTQFTKLDGIGLTNSSSTRWKYKLVNSEPEKDEDKPYSGSIIDSTSEFYSPRTDIKVEQGSDENYGYILLLATDDSGKTKGYKYIKLDSSNVREHASIITGAELTEGSEIDTTKVEGLNSENKYRYIIETKPFDTPSLGDYLPINSKEYTIDQNIKVKFGDHLIIFELDKDGNIGRYRNFLINSDSVPKMVKQGTGELKLLDTDELPYTLLEGEINNGGKKLSISLNESNWVDGLEKNADLRSKLYKGLVANIQDTEWAKVINALIEDGFGNIEIKDNELTISLVKVSDYNIGEEQEITTVIHPDLIQGAQNPIYASGKIVVKPTVRANISGDVVNSIVRASDIKAGGKTIVIDLVDGNWKINFDKNKLLSGFTSKGDHWAEISKNLKSENINRDSSRRITITLPPVDNFTWKGTTPEVINLKIDSSLLIDASEDIMATPSFTLYPDILKVKGKIVEEKEKVILVAPDYKSVDTKNDTWQIKITNGSLKSSITNDVIISGLPKGLTTNISKVGTDTIEIKVSGIASATLPGNTVIKVKVKGSAVTESNSIDSDDIELNLVRGDSLMGTLEKIKVDVLGKMLVNDNEQPLDSNDIEFSLDSTNGTNGNDWKVANSTNNKGIEFKSGKVFVREKSNPKVFKEIANLTYPKAPTGIIISEVDYSNGLAVKLTGFEYGVNYDISTNGGSTWDDNFDVKAPIKLDVNADLRARYRATNNSLSSLATIKLNGLDLRNVTLNIGEGKIKNTTTAMEYSLNGGETFAQAKANESLVTLIKDGKVIIRERAKPINERIIIDSIPIEELTHDDIKDNISINISTSTITDNKKRGLQYRIGSDSWKDFSSTNEEIKNIDFKQGKLEFRVRGTENTLPSEPIEFATILAPASAPELMTDDFNKEISYWYDSKWIKLETPSGNSRYTLEYKIGDESWKNGSEWPNDIKSIKNSNVNISVRVKATETTLPSLAKTLNFTGNLTFENVKLNVVEGRIDGTTTSMQYSTSSTDGLNGTWIDAKANNTPVEFARGMIVYIREKSKPLNYKSLTVDVNGNNKGIEVEDSLSYEGFKKDFDYSIVDCSITNKSSDMLEYRFDNGNWTTINRVKSESEPTIVYGIQFNSGSLQFRRRGTENTLPSPVKSITINTKASAPQLKYDDVKYTIEKIGSSEGEKYEYSINNGPWTTGNINKEFEGRNIVLVRLKATEYSLPSLEQRITFSNNLYLGNVILNAGKSQLENTSTLMEYSLDSNNGEDGLWFQCIASTTKIPLKPNGRVFIREKAKPRNSLELRKDKPIEEKVFPDGNKFVRDNLDYDVLRRTISFKKDSTDNLQDLQNIVNGLQYRIGNDNWINVDYVFLTEEETLLAFNVDFIPGNLEFRLSGDENTLPSKTFLKATIKAQASAPDVSKGFDLNKYKNAVIFGENVIVGRLEYSFGENGPWIDGKHLNSEDLVGNVYIRTKANKNNLPSLTKVLEFTPVSNLRTIILSTHVKPLELNGTTAQMEYRINNGIWQNCSDGNTKLKRNDGKTDLDNIADVIIIEIRDKNQTDNLVIVYQNP